MEICSVCSVSITQMSVVFVQQLVERQSFIQKFNVQFFATSICCVLEQDSVCIAFSTHLYGEYQVVAPL